VPDDPPLFVLTQAMWSLDQDWRIEFADPYEALEDWFQADGVHPQNLQSLIADVDQLFAEDPDAQARLAHFPHTGLRVEMFDAFLRAIRARAVRGLAGDAEPMRAPDGG